MAAEAQAPSHEYDQALMSSSRIGLTHREGLESFFNAENSKPLPSLSETKEAQLFHQEALGDGGVPAATSPYRLGTLLYATVVVRVKG